MESDTPVCPVLRQDLSFLYLAGGHVPCGCGFPDEPAEAGSRLSRLEPADARSLEALAEYIRPACTKGASVQLYLCWVGMESDPPESERSVSLDDLKANGFRLKHKQLLSVASCPETLIPRSRSSAG